MLIKFKVEQREVHSSCIKDLESLEFNLPSNADVAALKLHLEKCTNIPVERQEIRTLTKALQNEDIISQNWSSSVNANILMLSVYNARDGEMSTEAKFLGFLALFDEKPDSIKLQKVTTYNEIRSPVSSETSVENDSDQEQARAISPLDDMSSTTSISSSSSDNESQNSVHSDNWFDRRKRKNTTESGLSHKIQKRISESYSPTTRTYLDEFPKYAESESNGKNEMKTISNDKSSKIEKKQQDAKNSVKSSATNEISKHIETEYNDENVETRSNDKTSTCDELHANINKSVQLRSTIETQQISDINLVTMAAPRITSTNNATEMHPIVHVAPEKRAYMIVISRNCNNDDANGANAISQIGSEKLLNFFFEKFQQAGDLVHLQFAENFEFTLFEGDIWIACDDSSTTEWLLANIIDFPKQYQAQRCRDFLQLQECCVVVPVVSKSKDMQEIFNLLQKQNSKLNTTKWLLQDRYMLDKDNNEHIAKSVSCLCSNECLSLLIDGESVEYLKTHELKLKYCFWKIIFDIKQSKD